MNDFITYDIQQDGICILNINRPPVNALSYDLLRNLKESLIYLSKEKFRVLIIKTDNNHFSAGADLKERKIMSKNKAGDALDNFNSCFNVLESFNKPVICAINGFCLGGGAELASACDLRIGSNDAIIGFPEVSIGIIPGAGGTQRLPKIIGLSNAKYWIFTAKKFTAKEAFDYGFLNFTCDLDNLLTTALDISKDIIKNAPIAVKCSKTAINHGYNKHIIEGLEIERTAYNVALDTKDRDEALKAFVEKRKPKWRNE